MALNRLKTEPLKLILFGGKGGVGKTTCASSTALYLSRDFKTLLISADPAHSLSDSFEQNIGNEIKEIKDVKNLYALEISAEKAFAEFKVEYEEEIKKIVDTSTYLDSDDINSLFTLPIPGLDEVMGLKTIIDLIEKGQFDKYIVDFAPTGHSLRLLTLPGLLDDWIKVLARMRWKYRYVAETFGGEYKPDESDDFLIEMKKTVKKIEGLLRDSKECEFIAITIPEDMAIAETLRLVKNLDNYNIMIKQLVVNNVLESSGCEFCRKRQKEQVRYLNQIREMFNNLDITIVPLQPGEVKGLDALHKFKGLLFK